MLVTYFFEKCISYIKLVKEMNQPDLNIFTLISKYSKGKISEQEYQELEAWLKEHPDNKKILTEYLVFFKIANRISFAQGVDNEEAWKIIQKKLERRKTIHFRVWFRYAAILLVTVALAISYVLINQKAEVKYQFSEIVIVEPGEAKAMLVLSDGSEINLEELSDSTIQLTGGTNIEKENEVIDYRESKVETEVFNTIRIPRGGEFTLILSDGTKVFLNSDSELTYPVKFLGDTRKVALKGEAYMVVAKNADLPFIVDASGTEIEVLGTEFNVKAYSDENTVETTLVEGKVVCYKTLTKENAVYLTPGTQAISSSESEMITVKAVDTRLYTSWKDGMFTFKSLALDEIMKTFSRWYDIEVQFEEPALKQLHFTGNLKRFEKINPHLEVISLTTNVDFNIVEGKIYVNKK